MWISPLGENALASRNLGTILQTYRKINQITQRQLADQLGYDSTYVSLLERGLRTITDRKTLARVARQLAIPPHVLGITSDDNAEYMAMLQFGDSVVRLSEVARRSGRAVDAVNELWPLIARLEARVADGRPDRDVSVLLAQARVAFGTSLGHVLPEERLATAARWTGKALQVAERLDSPVLLAYVLRMHGNELRKAGYPRAGVARLMSALELSHGTTERGETLALLARATGELADVSLFDQAIRDAYKCLGAAPEHTMLLNPFALHEIRLRGLLATGRSASAAALAVSEEPGGGAIAPQWAIMERVTTAGVLIAAGEAESAAAALLEAVTGAEQRRLPHQLQRVIRTAAKSQVPPIQAVQTIARDALSRVRGLVTLRGT